MCTVLDIAFIGQTLWESESPRRTQHWMRGSSASPREYHNSCRRDQRHAHCSHRPWVRTIRALRRWVGMCQLPGPPCHPLDLWHARHRGTSDSGMRAAAAGAASKLPCAGGTARLRHGAHVHANGVAYRSKPRPEPDAGIGRSRRLEVGHSVGCRGCVCAATALATRFSVDSASALVERGWQKRKARQILRSRPTSARERSSVLVGAGGRSRASTDQRSRALVDQHRPALASADECWSSPTSSWTGTDRATVP